MSDPTGQLILADGSSFPGLSFGRPRPMAGEVVFNTGMVGYPEALTDPSYYGQIVVFTFPMIGNYGVPADDRRGNNLSRYFESNRIQVAGVIVADYSPGYSHWSAVHSLGTWLFDQGVPALTGIDTRALTKKLREQGTMLGKIEFGQESIPFYNPNIHNLLPEVSVDRPETLGREGPLIVLIDCGCKHRIMQHLLGKKIQILRVPWNYNLSQCQFDGLVISNGPGDPRRCDSVVNNIRLAIARKIPTFGICLGHQLLAIAAGANIYKLKFGHRSQNQPVMDLESKRCLVTSQNHGFAVEAKSLPANWHPWFTNLNDGSNEGIRHRSGRFLGVQFHPEAAPGPVDTSYLFDHFLHLVRS